MRSIGFSVEENESANWVMVYGFAPGDAADVLNVFSRHGTIVARKVRKILYNLFCTILFLLVEVCEK